MSHQELDFKNKLYRFLWNFINLLVFRFTPVFMHKWRCLILNLFGANVDMTAHIYPTVKIFNPRNLKMGKNSCLAPNTICFNVNNITISNNSTISQNCHLCSASRKYTDYSMSLISKPIIVEENVWVAADVFIGPGVILKKCSVILARSVVVKSISPNSIVQGNPGKIVGKRKN